MSHPLKALARLLFPKKKPARSRRLRNKPNFPEFRASHRIATVLDVGANRGQFGAFLRQEVGYAGRIISVEPLPAEFEDLKRRADADPNWTVTNLALGAANGTLPLNIAGNSFSSSFLPMLERHVSAAPHSRYRGGVAVPVMRLDAVPELCAASIQRCMLKIDAQGYEREILAGAKAVLADIRLIFLETSLVPLYEGGPLIEEIIALLRGDGFAPIAIYRGFSDRATGDLLQADVLFANLRKSSATAG